MNFTASNYNYINYFKAKLFFKLTMDYPLGFNKRH